MKYNYFKIIAKLCTLGFIFSKELENNEEEWINHQTNNTFKIFKEAEYISYKEVLHILNQANISLNDFMNI